MAPWRNRTCSLALLALLALVGCGPTSPLLPTAVPSPAPTVAPTVIWTPTRTPAVTATPGLTPTPPPPLGLVRLWRTATGDSVWDIGVTDIEGDRRPEVWAASYDHSLYLITATGGISWSFATAGPIYAAVTTDLEGDGRPDFLVGGDDNTVRAISGSGAALWSYRAGGRVTHLAAGDVDGDGRSEAVAATWDGALHIVASDGKLKQRIALDSIPTALATADLDGDGSLEILVGTEAGQVLALSATGKVIWQRGIEGPVRGMALGDFDGDRQGEVLVGSRSGMVALIGMDGEPRWAQREGDTIVSLAGVEQRRLVLLGLAHGLVALDATSGLPLWDKALPKGVWSMAVLGKADPVLAAGTDGGEIYLLNLQGQVRGVTALSSRVHGLASADLNHDGRPELLARSGDYVYAFRTDPQGEAGEAAPGVPTLPRWPDPSPLPPLPEGHIALAAVGDVMLGRSVEERMQAYGTSYPFQALAPLLRQADIAVGNLESVLAQGGDPVAKMFVYRAHPQMATGLAQAGFDVLNLANNHILDYGPSGLTETLATLDGQGIHGVGAGPQAADPVLVEARGIRVAFLARNIAGPAQPGVAGVQDEASLRRDVWQARKQADLLVLLLHTGTDYDEPPTLEQRHLAQTAIEAGANLVIGFHRYTVQDTESYGHGFIAYGLGDFTFDIDIVDAARDGAVLWVLLNKDGVAQVDWIPTRTVDDVQARARPAPGGRVDMTPLLVQISEPLPPPPALLPTYVLTATVITATGQVGVQQEVIFPNTTGDSLDDLYFFVFPNAYPDIFSLVNLEVEQGGQVSIPSYVLSEASLHVFLAEPLARGSVITVNLAYSLSLPPIDPAFLPPWDILGRSSDGRALNLGHWYPQLVPYQKGYGWQTWDYHPVGDPYYADLSNYRVTVVAPAGYSVFGAGERQQEGARWRFALDAVRDFALVLGRDYLQESGRAGGVEVQSAFRREHAAAGQAVLDDTLRALELFQERYGPYPAATYTVVESDLGGAQEYGNMAVVGAQFYESYQGLPTATLPTLAVHELAHQWWYNVVGNDAVHEPWLDEALATYSELIYYEEAYSRSVDWWWEQRIDRWNPSGPVDATIYDYDDTITYIHNLYGQAAHFMQDLRTRMGDEAFFSFLQRYYRDNAWRQATRRDFFRALEAAGAEVDDLVGVYFRP
jgi:poly-gamma-glutamate capsule biosynthesis protein CapA/YwtB (metallophosphatase superfamily)